MRRSLSTQLAGLLAGAMVLAGTLAASAAPLSPKEAKRQLFKGSKIAVELLDLSALSPTTRAQAEAVAKSLTDPKVAAQWQAMGFSIRYYGAMAVMADRALSDKSMAISNNLHSPEVAMNAALAACNALAAAQEGGQCVPVALILPKRYKARDLTLSQGASQAFRDGWERTDVPQYLAYSPSSASFVIARGAGADATALERCNAASEGANDCQIAIAGP